MVESVDNLDSYFRVIVVSPSFPVSEASVVKSLDLFK
jgi:hypothetical protein